MADGGITAAMAARELLRRRRARASLVEYSQAITIPGAPASDDPDEWLFRPIETQVAAHHMLTMQAIERCIRKDYGRLIIMEPPGSAKSTYASVVATTWAMGAMPGLRVLMTSYAGTPIIRHAKRARQIVMSPEYASIWEPRATLVDGSKAADEWELTNGSGMYAAGLMGGLTSSRCDLGIIDDPVAGREEADSETMRVKTRQAYDDDFMTRLKPGASVILIQCMAAETRVTMADGAHKRIDRVRPGDYVRSWDGTRFRPARVRHAGLSGRDRVLDIRTTCGSVRANGEHPFLVTRHGEELWINARNLRPGDAIRRDIGANGETKCARSLDAKNQPNAKACACRTTARSGGGTDTDRRHVTPRAVAPRISGIATALMRKRTAECFQSRTDAARYAVANLASAARRIIGAMTYALTTTMTPVSCAGCCATNAILPWATRRLQNGWTPPRDTFAIVSGVNEGEVEDVYNLEVADTHTFVANGFVTHNTRWHEDDLAGSILPEDYAGESGLIKCRDGQEWDVLSIPARCERDDDPLGRNPGEYLWPEWFRPEHWAIYERNPRTWSALYQQSPTPDDGIYFRRDDFRRYDRLPATLRLYMASDFAVTSKGGDWTEHGVFGIDSKGDIYVIDWWSGQESTDRTIDAALDLAREHKPVLWIGEKGVIESSIGPAIIRRMRERRIHVSRELLPSGGDKVARARGFSGRVAAGTVHVPKDAEWADALIAQLAAFPAGRHDDKVDVCGLIGRALDTIRDARPPAEERPVGIKPFTREWLEYGNRDPKPKRF